MQKYIVDEAWKSISKMGSFSKLHGAKDSAVAQAHEDELALLGRAEQGLLRHLGARGVLASLGATGMAEQGVWQTLEDA